MDTELTPMPLVLMYHSVEPYDADPYQVTVRPQRFDRQLRWLRRRGLRGVSMSELLRRPPRRARRRPGRADLRRRVRRFRHRGAAGSVAGTASAPRCSSSPARSAAHNSWDEPGPRKSLMTADGRPARRRRRGGDRLAQPAPHPVAGGGRRRADRAGATEPADPRRDHRPRGDRLLLPVRRGRRAGGRGRSGRPGTTTPARCTPLRWPAGTPSRGPSSATGTPRRGCSPRSPGTG